MKFNGIVAVVMMVVTGCSSEPSGPEGEARFVEAAYVTNGSAAVNAHSAAGDVFRAILSGDFGAIPSLPAAKCEPLKAAITVASASINDGTFELHAGGTRKVRNLDVAVVFFDGSAASVSVLDDIKTLSNACYVAQPAHVGGVGDFIVTSKTNLGGGSWRYEIDPTTATLNAETNGVGSAAVARWEDDTPCTVVQWGITCLTPLAGMYAGQPAVTTAAAVGSTTSLILAPCTGIYNGKLKVISPPAP